jgi:hypothetical protein
MTPEEAKAQLDNQVREIIQWHFSPETGCPFWLDWAKKNFDPRGVVNSYEDIIAKFQHFQDEWLRDQQPEVWVPAAFKGKPFNIFETGGTTGMPKQRIGWNDFRVITRSSATSSTTSTSRRVSPGSWSAPPARVVCASRWSISPIIAAAPATSSISIRAS